MGALKEYCHIQNGPGSKTRQLARTHTKTKPNAGYRNTIARQKGKINPISHRNQEYLSELGDAVHRVWYPRSVTAITKPISDLLSRNTTVWDTSTLTGTTEIQHSKSHITTKVVTLLKFFWKEWEEGTKSSLTKSFFPDPQDAAILASDPPSYEVTQILTGHCSLNIYLHRINRRPALSTGVSGELPLPLPELCCSQKTPRRSFHRR